MASLSALSRSSTFLGAIVLLALLPPAARAGDPPSTLGSQLVGTPVYADTSRTLEVRSSATVPMSLIVAVTGDGWAVTPSTFDLAPGERETLTVTSVGSKPGEVYVTGFASSTGPIVQQGSLTLGTQLYDAKPGSGLPIPVFALLGATAVLAALWVILRRRTRQHE